MKDNCRRCGEKLNKKSDLWCSKCRKEVDQELHGEISRPLEFYFHYYNKNVKHRPTTD